MAAIGVRRRRRLEALRAQREGRGLRGARREPRRRARRVRDAARAVGLRQDDDAADDRRLRAADGGRISLRRRRTSRTSPANQRNIGFVFQNYALFPHLSVFENVAYGLRVQRASRPPTSGAASPTCCSWSALPATSSSSPRSCPAASSSASRWRARSSSGRACCCSTSRCRISTRKLRVQMRGEIRDLQQRLGITTVYVTHDQEEAMAVSDRIAVMNRGVIVQEGNAETSTTGPASAFVAKFIGRVEPDRRDRDRCRPRSRRAAHRRACAFGRGIVRGR